MAGLNMASCYLQNNAIFLNENSLSRFQFHCRLFLGILMTILMGWYEKDLTR